MKTLIITIVEDIEDCYGLTSYANADFTLIKLSQKKMVSESHVAATVIHELTHALVPHDKRRLNCGHDNFWFTVCSHLVAIINGNLKSLRLNSSDNIIVVSGGRAVL